MKTAPRYILVVFPEAEEVSQLVTNCRVVLTMMTNNPSFGSPMPSLSDFEDHLDTLAKDEQAALHGDKLAIAQRNVSLGTVRNDARLLKAYVQSVADSHRTEAEAVAVIKIAGMQAVKRGVRVNAARRRAARQDPPLPGQWVALSSAAWNAKGVLCAWL